MPNTNKSIKRLYLSETDKKISGVCGGIGEFYHVDSSLVRLAWIILTILTGVFPGLVGYIIAAVVIPRRPAAKEE